MMGLLAAWTARSLALAGLLAALLAIARVRNSFLRKDLWTLALVLILTLPLLMHLPGLAIHASLEAHIVRATAALVPVGAARAGSLEWLYAGITGLLLTRCAIGFARMAALRAAARRVDAPWADGLDVRTSAALRSPATFGRTILLPDPLPAWSEPERAAILAHERAHVRGRDCYRLWLAQLYKCVAWFNPLAWWLVQHLTRLAEATSDAAALACIGDGPRYAQLLLDFGILRGDARSVTPNSTAAAMVRSHLGARIERILGGHACEAPPRRSRLLLAAGALVPLALLCALGRAQPGLQALDATPAALAPHGHSVLSIATFRREDPAVRRSYPARALRAGKIGWAYVRVTVDPSGHATGVQLIRVSPRRYGFAAAALRVARTIHYRNDTHRTVVAILPVEFALSVPPATHRAT